MIVQGELRSQKSQLPITAYERADSMLSWNLEKKVYRAGITPNWIDESHFWYAVQTPKGREFVLIDVEEQKKVSAENFPGLTETKNDKREFRVANGITSPNGQWIAYRKDWNLWVMNAETGEHLQLTKSGKKSYGYATHNDGWRHTDKPVVSWSPDSKKLATYKLDERGVREAVLWETSEGHSVEHSWPLALPGDSSVPMMERLVIDIQSKKVMSLKDSKDHQRYSNCCGSLRGDRWADVRWSKNGDELAYVSVSRDYKVVTLKLAEVSTGKVREVLKETEDTFYESNLVYMEDPNWHYLFDTDEVIWFSRKDDWGHLYLFDGKTGQLKNQITSGDWNVISIKHIDTDSRKIYFTGVGREQGQDPYQHNFYSVNFDGTDMNLLTKERFDHSIYLSPEANYFVDVYSDFQTPEVAVLKNIKGERIMELELADISELRKMGWQAPQPFTVKARDGETDIYGIMLLPSNFDPNKKYPIINRIYPGPQVGSIRTRSFSAGRNGEAQALAELGFVVVLMDALGSPFRSKSFHTAWYGNMQDNGLQDQISGMKQLASRYDFIDIERAGIYGHSGGGYATAAALLHYPNFFKVGVSSAGNHDNAGYTYYWGEKYQGLLKQKGEGNNYESQANQNYAQNLKGKLLITYGTMDDNVHPNMSLLLVRELINHNKDFDMLALPNRNHGYSTEPYHVRRTWDYFVKHLMGKNPPKEYLIER